MTLDTGPQFNHTAQPGLVKGGIAGSLRLAAYLLQALAEGACPELAEGALDEAAVAYSAHVLP